jgi:hypothetical protein
METQLAPVPAAGTDADSGSSLEIVELEFALDLADVAAGFDAAARTAADATGGALLFTMPTVGLPDCSRIAAISLTGGAERELVLVVLGGDGKTTRVEKAADNVNPFAELATSWARVMERMPAVAA